jgi:probable HAF family extracellular repeat protein
MLGLGDLPGGSFSSFASGVSGDGSVVVGLSNSLNGSEAFRWTTGGMLGLGDLNGGSFFSSASGVSGDGSVVVGQSESLNGTEAFRWTTGGMLSLGDLPGGSFSSYATGVSGDGSVVVGAGQSASGEEAFLWTAGGGMEGLYALLLADGADLTGWSRLERAQDISPDGRYVVGWGIRNNGNTEAFLADLGPQGAEVPEASTWAAVGALALAVGHTARAHAKRRGAQSASGLAHSTT